MPEGLTEVLIICVFICHFFKDNSKWNAVHMDDEYQIDQPILLNGRYSLQCWLCGPADWKNVLLKNTKLCFILAKRKTAAAFVIIWCSFSNTSGDNLFKGTACFDLLQGYIQLFRITALSH